MEIIIEMLIVIALVLLIIKVILDFLNKISPNNNQKINDSTFNAETANYKKADSNSKALDLFEIINKANCNDYKINYYRTQKTSMIDLTQGNKEDYSKYYKPKIYLITLNEFESLKINLLRYPSRFHYNKEDLKNVIEKNLSKNYYITN